MKLVLICYIAENCLHWRFEESCAVYFNFLWRNQTFCNLTLTIRIYLSCTSHRKLRDYLQKKSSTETSWIKYIAHHGDICVNLITSGCTCEIFNRRPQCSTGSHRNIAVSYAKSKIASHGTESRSKRYPFRAGTVIGKVRRPHFMELNQFM